MKKTGMFLAAMVLMAGIFTACGRSSTYENSSGTAASSATEPSGDSPTATAGATINIENMAFGKPLTVAPGAEITIANNDSVEHSVTSDTAGAFDVGVDGQQKKTLVAPSQPGEYPFHCSYHPSMKGTLIVK